MIEFQYIFIRIYHFESLWRHQKFFEIFFKILIFISRSHYAFYFSPKWLFLEFLVHQVTFDVSHNRFGWISWEMAILTTQNKKWPLLRPRSKRIHEMNVFGFQNSWAFVWYITRHITDHNSQIWEARCCHSAKVCLYGPYNMG